MAHRPTAMPASLFFDFHRRPPVKTALLLCFVLLRPQIAVRADPATVASNANTLISAATAQTSPYTLTSGYNPSLALSLSNAEKWTNLPGTPPNDTARVGPVIGGGSYSYNSYELSSVVSSGQSVSPRQAALNLAAATTSTAGYAQFYETRNADNVLSTCGGGSQYNYSDYRADVLNNATPSSTSPFIIKYAGHHLAYTFTYNFPAFNGGKAYASASPMFLGLEPPDYQSTGTDLTNSSSTPAENGFIVGTNSGTAGTFLAFYPDNSSTSLTTITAAAAAASLPARVNVTATAITGATSASYTISSPATADNGFYFCKVTNGSGSTNSNTVVLTITGTENNSIISNTSSTGTSPAPVITSQPASRTIKAGTSVTFSLTASNATSYQWYKIAAVHRAAMETQRTAVCSLAVAIQNDSTLASSAKLSGTFSDVVEGSANANPNTGDSAFPQTYPTGTTGRGVLFSSMTAAQQATLKPLIKATIEAWVNNAPGDAAAVLLADYESDAAINATYVGYQVGAGAADGGSTRCNFDATINQEATPQNSQHSYLRIDGPRCWVEMVVQNAVLYQSNGFVHYHSIYRDKLSDYGGEFGSSLNGASTSSGYTGTAYTRPVFTTQPTSVTGASATFTAAATANTAGVAVAPAYQWYDASGAISSAMSASYTTSTAGNYYVTATTAYGTTASNTVTFTLAAAPAVATQPTSVNVVLGNSASFSVAANGTGTLSYQWYKGSVGSGTAISGATSATYTISATATSDAGKYYCVVTNAYGSTTTSGATLTLTEPLANFLSAYNLTSYTADADGDGISNLLEFVLGGDPTVASTAIQPTATRNVSNGTPYLVFSFYTVANLGSVIVGTQYSTDLSTWTTAANGTGGVTVTTTAYSGSLNYTTVTIPDTSNAGRVFARLVATVPNTYSGSYSSTVSGVKSAASETVSATKTTRSAK